MSRRTVVLAASLVLVLGLVGWLVFALSGETKSDSRAADAAPVALETSLDAPHKENETLASLATDPSANAAQTPSNTRAVAVADLDAISTVELSNAFWVEGRVKFPDGTPIDERAVVVAVGKEFGSKKLHRAAVTPDGRFRVAFSKATKKATLKIEARYVFLEEPLPVKPETQPKDIELSPRLGGAVRGKLKPSAGAQPFVKDLVGLSISAVGWKMNGGSPRTVSTKVDENLEFELGGFDPEMNWQVSGKPKTFTAFSHDSVAVEKAAIQTVEFEVQRGAHFTGLVRDEQGALLAKVHVAEASMGMDMDFMNRERTKEDGRYEIYGVTPGKAILSADCDGYLSKTLEPLEVTDGEERLGFDIVLSRGNSVSGLVQWPDGKPAPDVHVEVEYAAGNEPAGGQSFFGGKPDAQTTADGTFAITGLGKGPFTVSARSNLKDVPTTKASPKPGKKTQKVRFAAELTGVAENATGLVLALAVGSSITGTVVDDVGAPIEEFRIVASPGHKDGMFSGADDITRSFSHKDGKFELLGLTEGEWEIRAEVKKGSASGKQKVMIPSDVAPLVLACPRVVTISGSVVTPDGSLVDGAAIVIERDGVEWWRNARENYKDRRTDAEGQFRCANVPPGALKIHATHTDWAPSETVPLDVVAAQDVGSIVLKMRRGGTIQGKVTDSKGKPAGSRIVYAFAQGADTSNATSRADGSFEMKRVTPGKMTLNLQASQTDMSASRDDKGQVDWSNIHIYNASKEVTVVEGETVEVALGGAPPNPVRLSGIVTNGKPIEGAQIRLVPDRKGAGSATSWYDLSTKSKADGHYAIQLDEPGDYEVTVTTPDGVFVSAKKTITGPAFTLDFALPDSRISGRVVSTGGKPLAQVGVHAHTSGPTPPEVEGVVSARSGSAHTDSEGKFSFAALSPGDYVVDADPRGAHDSDSSPQSFGKGQSKLLKLTAGSNIDGVEIVLPEGGVLRGTVVGANGQAVAGARISVNSANGQEIQSWQEESRVDSAGRFRVDGLSPGQVTISAHTDTQASVEVVATVRSNEDTEVALTLVPGGFLRVTILDASGKPVNEFPDVRDANGRQCRTNFNRVSEDDAEGSALRVGPLAPGTYTVGEFSGKDSKVTAQVSAGSERAVELHKSK